MAIGKSAYVNKKISINIGKHLIISKGEINKNYKEAELSKYLKNEIIIYVDFIFRNWRK